jgi:hypothetical protein
MVTLLPILLPLIWLAVAALVVTACRVASAADGDGSCASAEVPVAGGAPRRR